MPRDARRLRTERPIAKPSRYMNPITHGKEPHKRIYIVVACERIGPDTVVRKESTGVASVAMLC